ncbi:mitochondrial protein C2orf69 homolog isoform X2 [Ambystoma mexicanum]|uniref:mitochondrial protein C2orf69 homolog isoform X2 n=1 Tax=Ambystoma mexicanum TaxID=8296 RepID=UPI0037E987C2
MVPSHASTVDGNKCGWGGNNSFEEDMAYHPENYRWKRWSFENAAALLSRRFPKHSIWIVKSSRMHLHKFSCYDNFVQSNLFGAPEHSTDLRAFTHLYALLVNAFPLAENMVSSQKTTCFASEDKRFPELSSMEATCTTNGCATEKESHLNHEFECFGSPSVKGSASFTLIGFSKGCVVLNQLLYELRQAKEDPHLESFMANIKSMYWLDGGHSGGSNTWVTSAEVLEEFAQTGILVNTHVTPYQVHDTMRSWIGKEHRLFVQMLREYGVPASSQLHFADKVPSLDNHFRVHEVF